MTLLYTLVKERNKIGVNSALVEVVEVAPGVVEVLGELLAHKAPVPGFENVISVVFRIGENEAVAISALEKPFIGWCPIKASELAAQARRDEVYGRAEFMLP